MNSGLFFASKFPIVNAKFVPFKNGSAEDGFANKGVLLVTLEISEGEYMVVTNTHLQAKFGASYSNIRSEQLRMIDEATARYVENLEHVTGKKPVGVLAAGDYNLAEKVTDEDVRSPEELSKKANQEFLNKYAEPKRGLPTSTW